MPALHGGAVWQPTVSAKRVGVAQEEIEDAVAQVNFSMKVVTFNGLALNEDEKPNSGSGVRTARLDAQFHQGQIALVGIQEARTSAGQRVPDHYKIYSSGFQTCGRSKHFGCELWIHKFLPLCVLADGQNVSLNDCKVTVTVQESRLLVANIDGPICFTAVVAHAPCVSAERPIALVSSGGTHLLTRCPNVKVAKWWF